MLVMLFDTETDGLIINSASQEQPRLVEIFCLVIEQTGEGECAQFREHSSFYSLVDPQRKIQEDVIKIHNIDNTMVQQKPTFAAIAPKLIDIINAVDRVVAHNVMFDADILNIEFVRAGMVAPDWPELLCTVEQTEHWFQKRLSLGTNRKGQPGLYQILFNEDFKDAHRAEADVRALARCYQQCERMGWNYDQISQAGAGQRDTAATAGETGKRDQGIFPLSVLHSGTASG